MKMGEGLNLASQVEEIEALSAIYGDDWIADSDSGRRFTVNIDKELDVRLFIRLTDDYPDSAPPYFELDAVNLNGDEKMEVANMLNDLYTENLGQPIIYIWVEAVREYLNNRKEASTQPNEEEIQDLHVQQGNMSGQLEPEVYGVENADVCPEIFHDEPMIDRKSTFQAHAAHVSSVSEVNAVIRMLLSNKKIAAATHNIQAYRIRLENGSTAEDCDDDGETHAGSRVLHLLNIVNAENVVVVVSRWYGGIQLGPDRFKHINNCARNILEKYNFINKIYR